MVWALGGDGCGWALGKRRGRPHADLEGAAAATLWALGGRGVGRWARRDALPPTQEARRACGRRRGRTRRQGALSARRRPSTRPLLPVGELAALRRRVEGWGSDWAEGRGGGR